MNRTSEICREMIKYFLYLSWIHREALIKAAGPRNRSEFHQYDGQAELQQKHNIHSYKPFSFPRCCID